MLIMLIMKSHPTRQIKNSDSIQYSICSISMLNVIFGLVLAASAALTGRAQTALVVTQTSPVPSGAISSGKGGIVSRPLGIPPLSAIRSIPPTLASDQRHGNSLAPAKVLLSGHDHRNHTRL